MKLLLDTHSFLWFVLDHPHLSTSAKTLIEDRNNQRLLSIASIWEMAIKQSIGKLSFALPYESFLHQQLQVNQIQVLGIEMSHATLVAKLPLHHRDPFDRLLIAQAMVENLPLVSTDIVFDDYAVQRLW